MAAITKEQIKRIYALGAGIGILEQGNKDDELHALVLGVAGKSFVSGLTAAEFRAVEKELLARMRLSHQSILLKSDRRRAIVTDDIAGMMNSSQQALAWRLIYRLMEIDDKIRAVKGVFPPSTATPGERMCGAIKKILSIEANLEAPFLWVKFEDGAKLIEQLKRYVRSAEKKIKEAG